MTEDLRFFYAKVENAPLRLDLTGISYCDGSYYQERENSDVTVLEYIVRGKGTILYNGERFNPAAGDVYILHQGSNHVYYSDAHDPWTKIFFNLQGNLPEDLLRAYNLQDTVLIQSFWNEQIFSDFYALTCRDEPQRKIFERSAIKFHEIVSALYTFQNESDHVTDEAQLLRDYLDSRVFDRVSIDELAASINRSPDYVIKLFRKTYSQTPYAYFFSQKMRVAEEMLRTTQLSCSEIAHRLQFEDPHYFSNRFKKNHGISPRQYRNAVRSQRKVNPEKIK